MLIDINIHAIDPPDPDLTYQNYLEPCRRAGVTLASQDRAIGLIQKWTEVLSRRPEPTTH
jgi:hypothetical protein